MMKITIITGDKDSGKTAYLRSLAEEGNCAGCLSPKVFREGRWEGYDLELIPGGETSPMLRKSGTDKPEWVVRPDRGDSGERIITYGPIFFYADRFREARDFLSPRLSDPSAKRWILDEIGPLEMAGEGLAPILERILEGEENSGERELYLSVRPSLVETVQEKFGFTAGGIVREMGGAAPAAVTEPDQDAP